MPRALLLIALVSVLCVPSRAQSPLPSTVVSCPAESGPIQNPIFVRTEVWAQTVQIPGATSFQLEFGEVEFEDPSDAVIVTNPLDGEVQRLDQAALKVWGNRSAWFNGSTATVSLELAPGSSGSVRLESALALADAPGTDDICGSDNRVPSSDNRVCRLVINGSSLCTGWLISDQSIILSAGHCFGGGINPNVIAQFNVPPSTSTGGIVAPPVASQFPLDRSTLQFNDGGVGDDWAVARLHPNPNGISAGQIFSHFALPTGLVPLNMTGRLTGYGGDPTPDPTRNFVQQSSTDSLSFFPSQLSPISHQIDSQGGNSGGPLIMEGTNTAVGIHTHGGCSNFLGSNHGTSIYHQALNQAIAATIGCAGLFLADGVSFQVTCSPTVYSAAPVAGRWNVAAVSGGSDWDIFREGTGSTLGGSACDFLISNGNLGTVPSISGEIRRFSGSSTARAQFASAQVLGLGQAFVDSWTQTRVLKVYQVAVPSGTPSLNVSVAGDATLSWQLYRPGTFGALWATRGTNMIISGQAGGPQTTVVPPVSGTYCLVVFRNNAPFSTQPQPPTLAVSICAGGSPPVALTASTPTLLPTGCGDFSITPTHGTYNVVGVASTGNYTLTMGPGTSATSGSATEFVAYNGLIGLVSPTTGSVSAVSASAPAVIEHVVATSVPIGTTLSSTLGAGHVLRAMSFAVQGTGGPPVTHEILVTGDPSLRWYLFDPGFGWRGRSLAIRTGQVGSAGTTIPLIAGLNGLVIAKEGGVPTANLPFSVRWGSIADHITLPGPGSSVGNLGNSSYQFTCTPAASRWNAVGILSTNILGWTLSIGSAEDLTAGSGTRYVLADGHAGPITPVDGLLARFGAFGTETLHQAGITTLSLGTGTVTWNGLLLHVFEFFVAVPGNYDIGVTGSTSLGWSLFTPDQTSAWRSRTTAALTRGVGTPENGFFLDAGWHAVVVSRVGIPPTGTIITCSVTQSQNPPPVLTAITPASLPAGSPQTTLVLDATAVLANTTVTWDGTTNLNVLSRTQTQLQVSVPASLLAAPGSHAIRLVNPAPGGGTSAPRTFTARAPRILAVTPTSIAPIPVGGAPVPIVVTGQDFHAFSQIHAGIPGMPTTFISSTELRSFLLVAAPEAMDPGAVSITVENGHFAQSNTVVVQVAPGGNNQGTLVRAPLIPNPSEPYTARLEGCRPGATFSVIIDFAYPTPIPHWPNAAADFVLRAGTPGQTFALVDGMGLVGPATPGLVFGFDPNGTAPGGVFTLTGYTMPASPLGARFSMQTAYVDPTSPVGFRLTWARTEDL